MRKETFYGVLVWLLVFPIIVRGELRDFLNLRGMMLDADDRPLQETREVVFRLYRSSSDHVPLWEETQTVRFEEGSFVVALGSVEPFSAGIFDDGELSLGIELTGDIEMTPRMPLFSVPYAHHASMADVATSLVGEAMLDRIVIRGVGEVINDQGQWTGSAEGMMGPEGPPGPAGPQGPQGNPTLVVPGQGLTGGGSAPVIQLAIAASGVRSEEIADGTIGPQDIGSLDATALKGGTLENIPIGTQAPTSGTFATLVAFGSTQVGGTGTPLQRVIVAQCSVDPPSLGNHSSSLVVIPTTGCQPSFSTTAADRVFVMPPPMTESLVAQGAEVSAANHITVQVGNFGKSTVNGPSQSWSFLVVSP